MSAPLGCVAYESDLRCAEPGRHVGLGIRLCTRHERRLNAWLVLRTQRGRPAREGCANLCQVGGCIIIGHGIGFGLRTCLEHEEVLTRLLGIRARDREAHLIAEAACGEAMPPEPRGIPGWGETSGGLPTLGKRR